MKEISIIGMTAVLSAFLLICSFQPSLAEAQIVANTDWPMFRHDLRHTGLSRYVGSHTGGFSWSYRTGGDIFSSPAIGSDGTVYVGSNDYRLYSLTSTGALSWSYETGFYVTSSPTIRSDGAVCVGSYDNRLYSLTSTGALSWSYETGSYVTSSPAIGSDGAVCVGSYDNRLYSLTSTGALSWSYETGFFVESSPAIGSDGTVCVGSWDNRLYSLTSAGAFSWSYETGLYVASSPAIGDDGAVYVGSYDNRLYSLTSAGALSWSYETGFFVHSSPAIGSDGAVCVGSNDGRLYSFTSTGALSWSYRTGDNILSSPAIGSDGTVYVGSYDNRLYSLTSAGALSWSYEVGDAVTSSPAIGSDGAVYVGSWDNRLYCFKDPTLKLAIMKEEGAGDMNLYFYNCVSDGDWTYWDADARNPSPMSRDFWLIPQGNNTLAMTEIDSVDGGEQDLAVLKEDDSGQKLYIYSIPLKGDWTYWDLEARNPLPRARDFWAIPAGNDTELIADSGGNIASMKNSNGDYNLYIYRRPYPGDWTQSDALARNSSPLARDLWIIPRGNNTVAMCGLDTTGDGDSDSLLLVRNEQGDHNVYVWNMPVEGDWTYWDALARNPAPIARDFWAIPQGNDITDVVGIHTGSFDKLGVMEDSAGDYNFYIWNAPRPGDWTWWDAEFRNPSPLGRDFWLIPMGDNTVDMAAPY
ncbi:MAG: PQQ-binding-like beta-propeller repeat protein [Candidatus Tritonobacter lacicola]|nr:PQQ-binding-like beta-propeller repeat protein [Candidatus Tritonobacter lacicola]